MTLPSDRIDHAAEAARLIGPGFTDAVDSVSEAHATAAIAQVHATLALAEQLRAANRLSLAAFGRAPYVEGFDYAEIRAIREGLGL